MVGLAIINSIIGGSTGGIVVLFFNKYVLKQKWSYLMSLNGALTGLYYFNHVTLKSNIKFDATYHRFLSVKPSH